MLFLSLTAYAQGTVTLSQNTTTHFERVAGLPHNTVLALLQDRDGFIWIGTADGLSRYDGYEFITYHHDPADSTSLSHNTVTALLEATDSTLWIGTENGLNTLNRRTGHIERHTLPPDMSNVAFGLFEDTDGMVWATMTDGVIRYNAQTRESQFFKKPNVSYPFIYVSRDTSGAFWLGGIPGLLHRFKPREGQFQSFRLSDPWNAAQGNSVVVSQNGFVWVGTDTGLGILNPLTGHTERVPSDELRGEVWLEDRAGGLWIESRDREIEKLWRYDPQTHTASSYLIDPMGTNRLTHDVRAMLEDRAGGIWVATLGGLFRMDPQAKHFTHWRQIPDDPSSLSSNTVMAIRRVHDDIWVGTLGGGLNRLDDAGNVTSYQHLPGDPASLCDDDVWVVHEDQHGMLWVGTEHGLCHFNPDTGRFARVGDSSYVYVLAEDEAGWLWVGGELLQRLDPQTGLMEDSSWKALFQESVMRNFQAIYPAVDGVVWLGTEFKGLHRFEPATGQIKTYPVATETANGLRGKAVRFIHPDPDGHTLWLGTDFGLVRFDSESETFRHYLQRDGLPGSSVFGILPDDDGFLWISTNQGLARFDPTTETFTVYTETDGTGNTEYNRRAAYRGGDGTFYFGGLNGVTSFHPSTIRTNPVVPPVAFTRIEAARRDTVRTLSTFGRDELRLSHLDYTFAFEYAALSYTNPSKNRYAYMLDGFDEGWVDAGTRRRAAYTNIPPGDYTFRVKGTNEDGVWNEQGTALHVHIAAPWWTSWWFRLLAMALILAVFYGAYRYRVAHLLHEERLRLRIAGDLHDEIGSKLSSIALASEMVTARATLGDRERRQLTEVTRQARRMVDDLRDIVWFVNPRHDHLDDLIVRMRHVTAEMLNGTRHTFHASGEAWERTLDMERRRHLYLMFREVLTNITRHAQADQVDIRLAQHNGKLELMIHDDGKGFDPAASSQGEGLHNLHTRAQAIGGTIHIESQPGGGTTVLITAKIPENRDGFRSL